MFLETTFEYTNTTILVLDIDSQVGYTLPVVNITKKRRAAPEELKRAMFRTSSRGIAKALNPNRDA